MTDAPAPTAPPHPPVTAVKPPHAPRHKQAETARVYDEGHTAVHALQGQVAEESDEKEELPPTPAR